MKRLLLAACLALFGLSPSVLYGQVELGGQGSWGDDVDFGIGARLSVGLPTRGVPLEVIGSFDYFFPDGGGVVDLDYWELNANVAYLFPVSVPQVRPYAGGGLNVAHASVDGVGGDTEVGFNLLGGAKFPLRRLTPYAELRAELGGGEQFVVTAGMAVNLGPGFAAKQSSRGKSRARR